ncbi:MDR family MFS transporter [Curtobacterium sp. MCBD17_035]|uniref:MDR family MFS transporter n=1 Tax=Curtobacterium sp. MCBD17_035 TaxID=2175673 RepID=UPI000DAA7476|nr:MDR family MFS transporter [Curtobacterium sp. MCBD17_035]WIB69115.1 MDR family MFS transporter [Curtobacterium sp. MCBD17_035]
MSHRQILLVIYGLMAGMFLGALDQTIVGTAIRTIGDDLHGLNEQAWVTTAYLIASTIMTPIYGKLSDIFGRRPLFLIAIAIFIGGSFAASFSTSMIMLAGFRGLQGLGAGGLMSLPLAIMGDMLAPRQRAKYQGYFLAVFGISSVIGPLVGGLFSGANQILFISGWRWVFLINVPIGVAALFMVVAFLHLPKVGEKRKVRIDYWGAALVIITLGPLLLVAEQGRDWGWTSVGSWTCYVLGTVGLIAFIIVERVMRDDAIIPMKLFRSPVFSMSTILGVLVGFGMFGAMLTLPLYLQIVKGLTPTESGFATLPMVLGLMIASITSGQIISRTGRYRIFPVTGTAITAIGFVVLTFITIDKPLWFLLIAMFLIGLGLGQLMQTLTLASQNSVGPRDIGVATSASTFFRQIGGTLGTAILLSVLFASMPTNISTAMENKSNLTNGLDAALTPSVANAKQNAGVMKQIWTPVVAPIKKQIQNRLDQGAAQAKGAADQAVTKQVTAAVQQQVTAGRVPAASAQSVIQQQVATARPAAERQALAAAAKQAHASVSDGTLVVHYSNAAQRKHVVNEVAPTIIKQIKKGSSKASASTSDTSDTSFLNGADPRLTRAFLSGFNNSAVQIYYVGLGVLLLAFILTWFFRTPPLRKVSALQEQANASRSVPSAGQDGDGARDDVAVDAQGSAESMGSLVSPDTGSMNTVPTSPDVSLDTGETRAPLSDAPTHGAHSAAAAVDSPSRVHTESEAPKHVAPVLEAERGAASIGGTTTPATAVTSATTDGTTDADHAERHGKHSA